MLALTYPTSFKQACINLLKLLNIENIQDFKNSILYKEELENIEYIFSKFFFSKFNEEDKNKLLNYLNHDYYYKKEIPIEVKKIIETNYSFVYKDNKFIIVNNLTSEKHEISYDPKYIYFDNQIIKRRIHVKAEAISKEKIITSMQELQKGQEMDTERRTKSYQRSLEHSKHFYLNN